MNELDKTKYQGYLTSISSILISHLSIFKGLQKELNGVLMDFKLKKRIAYEKPFTFIPIDLLKQLFFQTIQYPWYNISIVFKLSGYIISIDNLYNDLNFTSLIKLKKDMPDEKEYLNRGEFYFSQLFGRINEDIKLVNDIKKLIDFELFGSEIDIESKIKEETREPIEQDICQ